MATVLVVGSGCREHVIATKLSSSPSVRKVLVAPGNGGTSQRDAKVNSLGDLSASNTDGIVKWCKENKPSLVVIGPEDPLNNGLVNKLTSHGIACFGPTSEAAQIECDKSFAKKFMSKYNIPTAQYKLFNDAESAIQFVTSDTTFSGYVVKATGLAAGKGVVVAETRAQACAHIEAVLKDKIFGDSHSVVIEDHLTGYEVSQFVFTDGEHYSLMPPAQDYKRAYDDDKGPNTGGMGSICPVYIDEGTRVAIKEKIIVPTINGMRSEKRPFIGVLYFGLMITPTGPKVIEYNCRFGDPECQTVLPLLSSDLYDVMQSCVNKSLHSMAVNWQDGRHACGIVLASENYPSKPITGRVISLSAVHTGDNLMIFHGGTRKRQEEDEYVSSGGRVLTVVSVQSTLTAAMEEANKAIASIKLEGSFYRRDIGAREALKQQQQQHHLTYKSSGVDIQAGEALVDAIKGSASSTSRSGVLESLGGFGALFKLNLSNMKTPILVSGTDGVGTKLQIAQATSNHSTIGIDLVAMCVNDILVQGAEPLFFLDYFACGHLDVSRASTVIKSIADGCRESNCALIGGETAEMPGMYHGDDYDLAGFAVGIVDEDNLLPKRDEMKSGDVIIGLPSSGLHSNGYSLLRAIVQRNNLSYADTAPFDSSRTLGDVVISPTKLYVKQLLPLIKDGLLKGLAHITGGGLIHNIPRILPNHLCAQLDANKWPTLPLYEWIHRAGPVSTDEMLQTFNCGIGMVCIVSPENVHQVTSRLKRDSESACYTIGSLQQRTSEAVVVNNFLRRDTVLTDTPKKRVAVLISGSGTNLQALIDYTRNNMHSSYEIALVISNKENAGGLDRAKRASIDTLVIPHIGKKRVTFDMQINDALNAHRIDLVALAGFMRLLSSEFVQLWSGKLINIHPSLLPSFKGMDTHSQALAAGVTVHGCTVHFVDEGLDSGAIILQKAIAVSADDTPETLSERVKAEAEHSTYPLALDAVARGDITLDPVTKKVTRKVQ